MNNKSIKNEFIIKMLITNLSYLINRHQDRWLRISSSAMTYDHLEAIINILKTNHRFIILQFYGNVNTNINKNNARWRELQDYYEPGELYYS